MFQCIQLLVTAMHITVYTDNHYPVSTTVLF